MRQARRFNRKSRGFTLLELLATLAISAILASLGWPLLKRQWATAAVSLAANRTLAALNLARLQAVSTGQAATVCPSADGRRCGFGSNQWMLFLNHPGGRDAIREPGEPLLQQWRLPPGVHTAGTRGYAAYQPTPRAAATLTFRICHRTYPGVSRSVVVSQTGRPRVSRPDPSSPPASDCSP